MQLFIKLSYGILLIKSLDYASIWKCATFGTYESVLARYDSLCPKTKVSCTKPKLRFGFVMKFLSGGIKRQMP